MNDGTLWISTNMGGVSILNLRENTFTSPEKITLSNITATNDDHGLSSPNAQSIIQDSFGNIWIGNYRGGIDFISHTQPLFNTIPILKNKVRSITKQVWGLWADNHRNMVGWRRRIRYLQRRERNQKSSPLNQCRLNKQTHISVIHQDKHGDLWLGTHKHGILPSIIPKTDA